MAKYKYIGDGEVVIQGVGVIKPDDVIESDEVINHPNFKLIDSKEKKS